MSAAGQAKPDPATGADAYSECRTVPRVDLEVEVGITSQTNFYVGFSENISEGGLFVATYDLKPVGSELQVRFTLPDDMEISVVGVVCWVRDPRNFNDPDTPPGLGVQFFDLPDEDREAIRRFTKVRQPIFFPD